MLLYLTPVGPACLRPPRANLQLHFWQGCHRLSLVPVLHQSLGHRCRQKDFEVYFPKGYLSEKISAAAGKKKVICNQLQLEFTGIGLDSELGLD